MKGLRHTTVRKFAAAFAGISAMALVPTAAFAQGTPINYRCYNGIINHCNMWWQNEGWTSVSQCVYASIDRCEDVEQPPQLICNSFGVNCRWLWW